MDEQPWQTRLRWRSGILLAVLAGWGLVACGWAWRAMRPPAGCPAAAAAAWRVGTLPALRGRILDPDGLPLAWSERHFALQYTPGETPEAAADWAAANVHPVLAGRLPPRPESWPPGQPLVVLSDLRPDEVLGLAAWLPQHPTLRLVSRFERQYSGAGLDRREQLGRTRQFGQREIGLSGWERHFEARLRGRDGRYRVMLDSRGGWIPGSWQQLQAPAPGQDVTVPLRLNLASTGTAPPSSR